MNKREIKREKNAKKPAENDNIGEQDTKRGRRISSRLAFVLVAVVAVVFFIYSLVTLIGIRSQIRERREELGEIQDKIIVQEIKNDEMNRAYNLSDTEMSDYIEQIARDTLDYVKEGERIFVNVSGD